MKMRTFNALVGMLILILFNQRPSAHAQNIQEAVRLTESEQFESARVRFNDLIRQFPNNAGLHYYAGDNFLRSYLADTGNVVLKDVSDSANRLFQAGIKGDPRNPLNYIGLAKMHFIKKDTATANKYLKEAYALLPQKKDPKPYLTPKEHGLALSEIGGAMLTSRYRDTTHILPVLRLARKLDPQNMETSIFMGDAYMIVNDGSGAILCYKQAANINPKSAKPIMRIGNLWTRAKMWSNALNEFRAALEIDSTFAPVYKELGEMYARVGQHENASEYYKKFLELSYNNISARISYANSLINSKQYKEAIPVILDIMKADSSRNDLNRALAYSYYESGQYDKGLTYMKKFFSKTRPEKIMISDYIYYGRLLTKNKMDSLAIPQLLKAWDLDTTNLDILSELGTSYNKVKDYSSALQTFNKLVRMKETPGYYDYYNLGKTYLNLAQYEKADTMFARVNEMKPDYVPAYFWRASANASLDPETKDGRAKPYYEALIEKTLSDPVKYNKELITAYQYLGYYFLKMKDYPQSKGYYEKILALDPANAAALEAIGVLKNYK